MVKDPVGGCRKIIIYKRQFGIDRFAEMTDLEAAEINERQKEKK